MAVVQNAQLVTMSIVLYSKVLEVIINCHFSIPLTLMLVYKMVETIFVTHN